jgi:hypothetical protein
VFCSFLIGVSDLSVEIKLPISLEMSPKQKHREYFAKIIIEGGARPPL